MDAPDESDACDFIFLPLNQKTTDITIFFLKKKKITGND